MNESHRKPASAELTSNATPLPQWPPQWPEIRTAMEQTLAEGHWGRYRGPAATRLQQKIAAYCLAAPPAAGAQTTLGITITGTDPVAISGTAISGTDPFRAISREPVDASEPVAESVGHCRLVSSGSLGVELALRAVGIQPGDHIVVCAYDYPGNLRAIEAVGGRPILLDAEPQGHSLCPKALRKLANERRSDIKAVLASHLYGVPAQANSFREICDRNQWAFVEDACQVPGAILHHRPIGSWGHAATFSFGGSKPLTAGCGGAIVTQDDLIHSRLKKWIDRPSDSTPLSELQASVLLPQIDRLPEANRIRLQTISELLARVDWISASLSGAPPSITCYKLALLLDHRERWIEELVRRGIPVGPGYRSMHRSRRCDRFGDFSRSAQLGERLLVIDHRALLAEGSAREWLIEQLIDAGRTMNPSHRSQTT